MRHKSVATATNLPPCETCGRPAGWRWLGNNYEPPKLVCGYHKRGYLGVLRYLPAINKEV